MWSGNEDVNDNGEAVRLYQPMMYGRKPSPSNLCSSFIGGQSTTTSSSGGPSPAGCCCCTVCNEPLKQLVQLYIPKSSRGDSSGSSDFQSRNQDRTLIVSACNRASCINGLFAGDDHKSKNGSSATSLFSSGGNGVIVCRRLIPGSKSNDAPATADAVLADSSAMACNDATVNALKDKNTEDGGDDWNVDSMSGGDNNMDDLEAKLASMESTATSKVSSAPKKKSNHKSDKSSDTNGEQSTSANSTFPCYELHSVQEPPARRAVMDEDDVGISASGASNDKIQQMLARYMQEEEDEDILAMLRGANESGSGGNNANTESDPGVSEQDRAMLRFTDRLQRSPRQVLRYAYNGEPMWSVPLTKSPKNQQKGSRKHQAKNKATNVDEGQVPPCSSCGAPRVFEAQILPSILHVLDVDRYAPTVAAEDYASGGGMDFGNIAIYTCSAACSDGQDEFVVVQDSIDKLQDRAAANSKKQAQRRMYSNNDAVVIPEGTKFDDNDDDGEEDQ